MCVCIFYRASELISLRKRRGEVLFSYVGMARVFDVAFIIQGRRKRELDFPI